MSKLFSSSTKTKSETKVDPRIMGQVYGNIDMANQIASRPFEAYGGSRFAGFNQDQQNAFQMARNASGMSNPYTSEAAAMLRQGSGYSPVTAGSISGQTPNISSSNIAAPTLDGAQNVSAGTVGAFNARPVNDVSAAMLGANFNPRTMTAANANDLSLDPYMNPYVNDVINAGLSDLDRGAEQQQTNLAAQAVGSRAFGGSRDAIQRGIAQGEAQRERARFLAESRMAAVNQAMQAREADVARRQQAGQFNLEAGMRADEMGFNAAQSNQRAGLDAALANQRTGAEFSLADSRSAMEAALANQRAGLDASLANQRAGIDIGSANARNSLEALLANQRGGLDAQTANQRAMLESLSSDQRSALEASLANQRAGLDHSQLLSGNARTLADLGQLDISNQYNSANALGAIGAQQQMQDQQGLDFNYDEFMRRLEFDPQMLALRSSVLSGMPYNVTQTGKTTSTPSPMQMAGQVASLVAMSDKRLKKSLSPLTGALPKLRKIQGSEWDWKDGSGPDAGVIAQDVEKVLPEAVAKRDDGMRMVNMPAMIGLLTESVKELDHKVSKKKRRSKK